MVDGGRHKLAGALCSRCCQPRRYRCPTTFAWSEQFCCTTVVAFFVLLSGSQSSCSFPLATMPRTTIALAMELFQHTTLRSCTPMHACCLERPILYSSSSKFLRLNDRYRAKVFEAGTVALPPRIDCGGEHFALYRCRGFDGKGRSRSNNSLPSDSSDLLRGSESVLRLLQLVVFNHLCSRESHPVSNTQCVWPDKFHRDQTF